MAKSKFKSKKKQKEKEEEVPEEKNEVKEGAGHSGDPSESGKSGIIEEPETKETEDKPESNEGMLSYDEFQELEDEDLSVDEK